MKNTLQKIRNTKGFTLVELMIVVAIIGILAAIAIPAFLRSVKKSKTSEAEGTMRKMADGAKGYFQSEQKYSPDTAAGGEQPWHVGVAAAGASNTFGMPVGWDAYGFPGINYTFNTAAAAADGGNGTAACTAAPSGGSKQVGFDNTQPDATMDLNAVLNRLGVSFPDQYYFTYNYTAAGTGAGATLALQALADFNTASATCHTISQTLSVDADTQEVAVPQPFTSFEFE